MKDGCEWIVVCEYNVGNSCMLKKRNSCMLKKSEQDDENRGWVWRGWWMLGGCGRRVDVDGSKLNRHKKSDECM